MDSFNDNNNCHQHPEFHKHPDFHPNHDCFPICHGDIHPVFIANTDNIIDRQHRKFQSEINEFLIHHYHDIKKLVDKILEYIKNIGGGENSGGIDEDKLKELIEKSVSDYFKDHPVDGTINEDRLKEIIQDILNNNNFDCGCEGSLSKEEIENIVREILKTYKFTEENIDNSIIENIVNNYFEENPPTGGNGFTKEQIEKFIEDYLKEHPVDGSVDKETVKDILTEILKESKITDLFDKEELKEVIKEALAEFDLTEDIEKAVEKWAKSNTEYFKEILQPLVDDAVKKAKEDILKELEEYLHNNERVLANSLARHEQAITELQI